MSPPMVTTLELRKLATEVEACDCDECTLIARLLQTIIEQRSTIEDQGERISELIGQVEMYSTLAEQDAEKLARTPDHSRVPWSTLYAPIAR